MAEYTFILQFSTGRSRFTSSSYQMQFWPLCMLFVDAENMRNVTFYFDNRHVRGRVLAALANGQVAIFCRRSADEEWDLTSYWLLELAPPTIAVRCLARVHSKVWAAFRNKIAVIDPNTMRVEVSKLRQLIGFVQEMMDFGLIRRPVSKPILARKAKCDSSAGLVMEFGSRSVWILPSGCSTLTTIVIFKM